MIITLTNLHQTVFTSYDVIKKLPAQSHFHVLWSTLLCFKLRPLQPAMTAWMIYPPTIYIDALSVRAAKLDTTLTVANWDACLEAHTQAAQRQCYHMANGIDPRGSPPADDVRRIRSINIEQISGRISNDHAHHQQGTSVCPRWLRVHQA